MKYRIYRKIYPYNPSASYFLLQCRDNWWNRWKTLEWYSYDREELAYVNLEEIKSNNPRTDKYPDICFNCTPGQTRLALELGAPIFMDVIDLSKERPDYSYIFVDPNIDEKSAEWKLNLVYKVPNTKTMIEWIKEQPGIKSFKIMKCFSGWSYYIDVISTFEGSISNKNISSQHLAVEKAINSALKFLQKREQLK